MRAQAVYGSITGAVTDKSGPSFPQRRSPLPPLFTADWSLGKKFALTEPYNLQFRWEIYNAFNRTNLALPDGAADSGTAGKIFDVASPMRNMQFGLHLGWWPT